MVECEILYLYVFFMTHSLYLAGRNYSLTWLFIEQITLNTIIIITNKYLLNFSFLFMFGHAVGKKTCNRDKKRSYREDQASALDQSRLDAEQN